MLVLVHSAYVGPWRLGVYVVVLPRETNLRIRALPLELGLTGRVRWTIPGGGGCYWWCGDEEWGEGLAQGLGGWLC